MITTLATSQKGGNKKTPEAWLALYRFIFSKVAKNMCF
jgi:hypothetical protein